MAAPPITSATTTPAGNATPAPPSSAPAPAGLGDRSSSVARVAKGKWKEFREFAFAGSVLDLAIGVVLGAAFNALIQAVVADVLTPLIGLAGGIEDLANASVEIGGVELLLGDLANTAIYFLITAAMLFVIVKAVAKVRRVPPAPIPPPTRPCRFCLESVPVGAARCRHCTSHLLDLPLEGPAR